VLALLRDVPGPFAAVFRGSGSPTAAASTATARGAGGFRARAVQTAGHARVAVIFSAARAAARQSSTRGHIFDRAAEFRPAAIIGSDACPVAGRLSTHVYADIQAGIHHLDRSRRIGAAVYPVLPAVVLDAGGNQDCHSFDSS